MKIYQPFKGRNIISMKGYGLAYFPGITITFATLLALFYGYRTSGSSDYMRLLSTFSKMRIVFASVMKTGILLLIAMLFLLLTCTLLLVKINSNQLSLGDLSPVFYALIVMVVTFRFNIPVVAAISKFRVTAVTTMLSNWFVLLHMVPCGVNGYVAREETTRATMVNWSKEISGSL